MSKDNLSGLLDSMLEESATTMEAEATEAAERARRQAAQRAAEAASKAPREASALDDIVQLTGLTDPDLRKILGKAAPDDLLVVLATADDALQRRVLRNLSSESVGWLRQNLEHMDHVNDTERDASRAKVLKVANRLLAEGEIGLPEPDAVGGDEAPDTERKELRELLTDLVRIADQSGAEALSEIAESAGEPLLRRGLELVTEGARGDALRGSLEAVRSELEARYAQRLKWMAEALVAVSEGETAESFAERVFRDA